MNEVSQAAKAANDHSTVDAGSQPWVKPAIERIPLNEAMNGPTNLTQYDGANGSIS